MSFLKFMGAYSNGPCVIRKGDPYELLLAHLYPYTPLKQAFAGANESTTVSSFWDTVLWKQGTILLFCSTTEESLVLTLKYTPGGYRYIYTYLTLCGSLSTRCISSMNAHVAGQSICAVSDASEAGQLISSYWCFV